MNRLVCLLDLKFEYWQIYNWTFGTFGYSISEQLRFALPVFYLFFICCIACLGLAWLCLHLRASVDRCPITIETNLCILVECSRSMGQQQYEKRTMMMMKKNRSLYNHINGKMSMIERIWCSHQPNTAVNAAKATLAAAGPAPYTQCCGHNFYSAKKIKITPHTAYVAWDAESYTHVRTYACWCWTTLDR